MTRRSGAVLCSLVAAVLLGGCSHASTLDHGATERAVGRAVAARVRPLVRSTTCPDAIAQRKGEVTQCTVTLAGTDGPVRVSVRQVDGGGRLTVTVRDAVLDNAELAEDLQAKLASSFGRPFTATCGSGPRVAAPGTTFRCTANDGNGERRVRVTVTDPGGTVTYDVSP